MLNVVSGCDPQVAECELEEKKKLWSEMDKEIQDISREERMVIGADVNGHVGEGNHCDEEVMEKVGVVGHECKRTEGGGLSKRNGNVIGEKKREEHRVTYSI